MNEETVRHWLRKAEHDLRIGRAGMEIADPVTDMVCFHMQQCVEKYLKAFLILHGKEYPKTHRLSILVALCRQLDESFAVLMDWGIDELTAYATTLRYGEEFYMPDVDEARRAIDLAERAREFVREKLRQSGPG